MTINFNNEYMNLMVRAFDLISKSCLSIHKDLEFRVKYADRLLERESFSRDKIIDSLISSDLCQGISQDKDGVYVDLSTYVPDSAWISPVKKILKFDFYNGKSTCLGIKLEEKE